MKRILLLLSAILLTGILKAQTQQVWDTANVQLMNPVINLKIGKVIGVCAVNVYDTNTNWLFRQTGSRPTELFYMMFQFPIHSYIDQDMYLLEDSIWNKVQTSFHK